MRWVIRTRRRAPLFSQAAEGGEGPKLSNSPFGLRSSVSGEGLRGGGSSGVGSGVSSMPPPPPPPPLELGLVGDRSLDDTLSSTNNDDSADPDLPTLPVVSKWGCPDGSQWSARRCPALSQQGACVLADPSSLGPRSLGPPQQQVSFLTCRGGLCRQHATAGCLHNPYTDSHGGYLRH